MRNYSKVGGREGLPGYRIPSSFMKKVFEVVRKIPKGKTMTYGQLAEKIGNPNACRAVGNVLGKNHDPGIPCHRVVRSDGTAGGYNRGPSKKLEILRKEGAL
jgi:O-6-methylguanine DNA methyltransferase